jgi:NADH-quinone oxidoreductase subunit C
MTTAAATATATAVEPEQWHRELAAAVRDGFDFPGFLAGTDRGETIEIAARLHSHDWRVRTFVTAVPAVRPLLPSITDVLPGFAWSEREIAEMLGVTFDGGDGRPLLRRDLSGPPPLLRTTPLKDRLTTPWPGAAEPSLNEGEEGMQRRSGNPSRRRQRPPGIPDSWSEQ